MSLVALSNVLHDDRMSNLFHGDPAVQATELLLQERVPVGVPTAHPRADEVLTGAQRNRCRERSHALYHRRSRYPATQLLSNGTYSVMVTAAGSGYSNCSANAVTRWREDVTRDNWGFLFICVMCEAAECGPQVINLFRGAHSRMRCHFRRTRRTSGAWMQESRLIWRLVVSAER